MRSITVLSILFSLLLNACGNKADDNAASATSTAPTTAPMKCDIESNGIAGIPLGTTITQVRQSFPKAIITHLEDAEGVPFFAIKLTPEIELFAYTENNSPKNQSDNENSPITYLDTSSRVCKTAEGVHPYMPLATAEQIYGAVQQIVMSETENRQTAEFDHQPPELSFRIDDSGAFDLNDTHLPKITSDYRDGAQIQSIAVVALPDAD